MNAWPITPLRELVTLHSGGTPSKSNPSYWNGSLPWASPKDMHNLFLVDTQDHVSEDAIGRGTREVSSGTILMVVRSMILARELPIAITTKRTTFNQDLKAIIPGDGLDNRFLFYWLLGNREAILGLVDEAAHGTKRIQSDRFLNLTVSLPPLDLQRRIASLLGAYDDLIEVNRRRVLLLEDMASRLFEEWFIRFRFPGCGNVEIVDTPDGARPSTWNHVRLDNVLVLQRGFDLPKAARSPGQFFVISASGRHGQHSEAKVKGPGVVTGRSGTIGKVHLVFEDHWPLNTTLYVKEYKFGGPAFAYQLLKNLDLSKNSSGSAVPTLNRNHVHDLLVAIPARDVVDRFEKAAINWLKLANNLNDQIERLVASRDLLLPGLLSGQLSVAAAEREFLKAA